ncbi:DUF5714 domain-containing protein [Methanolobus sp. ZRKC5]|uniref:DUF5714 domain-containing protein n=1 Tax=unclassified Methanolobus TaxID=2629569 RepID=UPI00313E4E87
MNCLVCEAEVEYLSQTINCTCHYCGIEEESYIQCKNGHYICNECHSQNALKVIENACLKTEVTDPLEIAEKLMEHPSFHMHGPEHHALVPGVLIAAYQNYIGERNEKAILEVIKRGQKIPGGYCGLYGACGAGIGVGVAVSVLLEATSLTPDERSHAIGSTSRALKLIADASGARCCKKSTRISLEEGMLYLSELFDLEWHKDTNKSVKCGHSMHNKECDDNCKYKDEKNKANFVNFQNV